MKFSIFNVFYFPIERVVWDWEEINEEFKELYDFLISKGKEVYLVTNNSVFSPREYSEKFSEKGLGVDKKRIISSAAIAGDLLMEKGIEEVYMIGEYGLLEVLEERGIKISDKGGALVIGIDRTLNYSKIKRAVDVVLGGGDVYLLDNATIWRTNEEVFPASMPLINYLKTIKSFNPIFVGRPGEIAKRYLLEKVKNFMESTIFISPYLEDMEFADMCGFFPALLTNNKIPKLGENKKVGYVINNLKEIIRRWK